MARKEYYFLLIDKLVEFIDSTSAVSVAPMIALTRQMSETESKLLMLVTDLHKLRDINNDTVNAVTQMIQEKLDGKDGDVNFNSFNIM